MESAAEHPPTIFPALRSWWWIPLAAALFAATAAAGFAMKSLGPLAPELGVDIALSQGRNSALIAVSETIHFGFGPVGAVILTIIICAYLLWSRGRPLPAVAFASVVAMGWLASTAAKVLVGRPRPPADATGALITETGHNSFPSGHTAFAVSLALAVFLVLARTTGQRLGTMAAGVAFVAIVAFSRMYLGVHYLSDVIGSVLISTAAILAWLPVWNNVIEPRISKVGLIRGLESRTPRRRESSGPPTL